MRDARLQAAAVRRRQPGHQPLDGDVQPLGSQFGLININLGKSSQPDIEQEILDDVASYGRQLGRMGDALLVLLAHFRPQRPLTADEDRTIADLRRMLEEIADVKDRHSSRHTMRPSTMLAGEVPQELPATGRGTLPRAPARR